MKLYANGDGYVRVHLTAKPDSEENYSQLDCVTADAVTVHPIHLRTRSSPTEDMPAPDAHAARRAGPGRADRGNGASAFRQ